MLIRWEVLYEDSIHTNKSDGELSPKEIIEEARFLGVSVISITDHDTIDAYDEKLFNYARKRGIKIYQE